MHLEILSREWIDASLQIFLSIPLRVAPFIKTVVIVVLLVVVIRIPFSRFQKLEKQTSIVVHVPPQRFFCDDHHDQHIYIYIRFFNQFFFSSSKRERERERRLKRGKERMISRENPRNPSTEGDINEGKKRKKETRWRNLSN